MGTVEDLLAELSKEEEAKRAQEAALTEAAYKPREVSGGEVASRAGLGILPILLGGLLGGKKGAYAGAVGAGDSIKSFDEELGNQYKQNQLAKLAELKNVQEQLSGIDSLQRNAQLTQAKSVLDFENQKQLENIKSSNERRSVSPRLAAILGDLAPDYAGGGDVSEKEFTQAVTGLRLQKDINEASRRKEQFERNKKERFVYGLDTLPGVVPTTKDAEEAKKGLKAHDQMQVYVQDLLQSLTENGQAYTGEQAVNQITALGNLLRQQKERFGGGAAYTEMERQLAEMVLPKVVAGRSLSEALAASGLGRNPIYYLRNLQRDLDRELDINLKTRGYRLSVGEMGGEGQKDSGGSEQRVGLDNKEVWIKKRVAEKLGQEKSGD